MKTLVIEDDYSANTMFVRVLENYGTCDSVTTGFDGLQKYRDNLNSGDPYDLIIIDIILPDMNGYTVLESIRSEEGREFSNPKKTRIILSTSLDDDENKKICKKLEKGSEEYYVKNYILEGLKETIEKLGIYL